MERALLAFQHGRHAEAEQELRRILADDPDAAHAHAALGLCLGELGRLDEAEREVRLATGLAPESDFAHHCLGQVLRERNRFPEAEAAAAEAIRLDPDDPGNRCLLASIHAQCTRWEACLAAADAGLALDPGHADCANLRALALTQLGRKDEAAATIAGALQRSPENSMTHANQGWALLHANRPAEAQTHFREALRLDPGNDFAREGLLNAIKAQNFAFRGILAFFLFMSRQRAAMRWALVIGVVFGRGLLDQLARQHPEWGIVLYPLIALLAVAIYASWLANPLMNLLMRAHPQGRHALSRDQYAQANLIGACLLLAGGLFACELAFGLGHLPSLMVLLTSIPLTSIHDSAPGWPRRISTIVATALGGIALFEALALHVVRLSAQRHAFGLGDTFLASAALHLMPVFFFGLFAWSLLAALWIEQVRPAR